MAAQVIKETHSCWIFVAKASHKNRPLSEEILSQITLGHHLQEYVLVSYFVT